VAWRTGAQQGVSRLGTVSLGGIFLKTPQPAPIGSTVDLLVVVSPGNEVRARAIVCNAKPGTGMGVKFVHMLSEDRSRLNKFLNEQLEAAEIQSGPLTTDAARHPPKSEVVLEKNSTRLSVVASDSDSNRWAETDVSEEELRRCLTLAQKGTHYQLLEIASGSCKDQVKTAFYQLARKFHPDRHMSRPEWKEMLQQVMGAATAAYETRLPWRARSLYSKVLEMDPNHSIAKARIVRLVANERKKPASKIARIFSTNKNSRT
jgi:DnaJ domain/PilZ domain